MAYADDFPLLGQQMPQEHRLVFLDNASTTQKPSNVLEVERDFYSTMNAGSTTGRYALSKLTLKVYEQARGVIASHIGANPDEIVFTHGATEASNILAYSWGLENVKEGDEIVLSLLEHESNLLPWQMVAHARKAKLVFMEPCLDGRIPQEQIEEKIGTRTKVVVASHISHIFGTVLPLEAIVVRAHEVGAVVVLDCALSSIRREVNVRTAGVDFALFSGHKSLAPVGTGLLYVREDHFGEMRPFLYGPGIMSVVGERRSALRSGQTMLEPGTPDVGGVAAFAAALRYLENIGHEKLAAIDAAATKHLLEGIALIPRVKVFGDANAADDRCGIVSFNLTGINPNSVSKILDMDGIAISVGMQEAGLAQGYLGTSGMCRVSLAFYNTEEDIEAFLESLDSVLERIAKSYFKS